MSQKPCFVMHICAPNDRNGNPRRCFAVFVHSERIGGPRLVEVSDEGYDGHRAISEDYRTWALVHSMRVNVTAKEYKSWLKTRVAGSRGRNT